MLKTQFLSRQPLLPIRSILVGVLFILPGCSVAMALSGKPLPRFEQLHIGMSREEAETILGPSAEMVQTKDGNQTVLYLYELGNEPSIVRAVIHFLLDVLTFGFWELPASVAELKQGEERRFPIVYASGGTVLLLNEYGNLH